MSQHAARQEREFPQATPDFSDGDHAVESQIAHFIPSVHLRGSRRNKLRQLDTLIAYLERLRRGLAGATPTPHGGFEGPSPYAFAPAWPWFLAGMIVSAVLLLLALFLTK